MSAVNITNYGAPCELNRWARSGPCSDGGCDGSAFGSFTLDLITGMAYQIKVTKYLEKYEFADTTHRGWRGALAGLLNDAPCCSVAVDCNDYEFSDSSRGPHEITTMYTKTYDFNTTSLMNGEDPYSGQMEMMRDDHHIFDVRGPDGKVMAPDVGACPLGVSSGPSNFNLQYWKRGKVTPGPWEADNISVVMPQNKDLIDSVDDYVTLSLDGGANDIIE